VLLLSYQSGFPCPAGVPAQVRSAGPLASFDQVGFDGLLLQQARFAARWWLRAGWWRLQPRRAFELAVQPRNFQIRLLQSIGAVTGYAQAVTRNLIGDLRAREIEGAARGLYWDLETALLWVPRLRPLVAPRLSSTALT
jgi:hypothetical protein